MKLSHKNYQFYTSRDIGLLQNELAFATTKANILSRDKVEISRALAYKLQKLLRENHHYIAKNVKLPK